MESLSVQLAPLPCAGLAKGATYQLPLSLKGFTSSTLCSQAVSHGPGGIHSMTHGVAQSKGHTPRAVRALVLTPQPSLPLVLAHLEGTIHGVSMGGRGYSRP